MVIGKFAIFKRTPEIDNEYQNTYYQVRNTETHRSRNFPSEKLAEEYAYKKNQQIMRAPKW